MEIIKEAARGNIQAVKDLITKKFDDYKLVRINPRDFIVSSSIGFVYRVAVLKELKKSYD